MAFTIQSLTDSFVNQKMGPLPQNQNPTVDRKRCAYNFKVTCFNIATVAAIATLALAILTGSTLLMALFAGFYMTRKSFLRAILGSDSANAAAVWSRMMGLDATNELKQHLEIPGDSEWRPVAAQVLDFIAYMEFAPAVAAPQNAAPISQQQ